MDDNKNNKSSEKENDKSVELQNSLTPAIWVSIFAAILSVIGALRVASTNAAAQRELEREQFESNLILKAISTGDKKQSYDNIRFLVEAHLIRRESDKIAQLIQDTSFHFHFSDEQITYTPHAAVASKASIQALSLTTRDATLAFSGTVIDVSSSKPLMGVVVSIKTRRSRMRNIETQITGADGKFTLHYPGRAFYIDYTLPGYTGPRTWHMAMSRFSAPLVLKMQKVTSQSSLFKSN